MDEENNNILGFGFFFFFIVLIVVGGSILVYLNIGKENQEKSTTGNNETQIDKMKLEKEKDFIYYTNEKIISESLSIVSKLPVINLNSDDAKNTTKELKNYVEEVNGTLKKNTENITCAYQNDEQILETNFLDFGTYIYQEYVTLLIRESAYSCQNGFSVSSKIRAYTFNALTGKKLTTQELLAKYDTSLTNVLEKVKRTLSDSQTMNDEEETIQIDETINNLKENETFVIYIDEYGDLIMNYVVKTSSVDYNDSITINEGE